MADRQYLPARLPKGYKSRYTLLPSTRFEIDHGASQVNKMLKLLC